MSVLIFSLGRARKSFQDQVRSSSTSPPMVNDHSDCATRGVGPAESTGNPCTRYWPGGRRVVSAGACRLPLKPREMNDICLPPLLLPIFERLQQLPLELRWNRKVGQ